MPCPHCQMLLSLGVDHRMCLIALFRSNKIQSVEEWRKMAETRTIILGKKRVKIQC